MIPTWLTIELALIPLVLATMVWGSRLEWRSRHNKYECERLGAELTELKKGQSTHNDKLYGKIDTVSTNLHLIMGKLGVTPVD